MVEFFFFETKTKYKKNCPKMKRWQLIRAICYILLIQFVFATPIAQLLVPNYPNQIHYVGDQPLPGGNLQSILSANFTQNQIVTGSGIPTNPSTTGLSGAVSMLGNTVNKVGIGLGSSLGSVVKGFYFYIFIVFF